MTQRTDSSQRFVTNLTALVVVAALKLDDLESRLPPAKKP